MLIHMGQAALYLAQRMTTSPWCALTVVVVVLLIALGWPNVIYEFEGIPTGAEAA
ncbi:hypothetical protein ACFXGA_36460 [Actinosynnema sp. NPDC059335]|uniref:hypothetical protein n=1 Tax=Actinosynnema sp. NPDC059335 TaxID=3346804 RepID=UPI00366CB055